MPTDPDTSLHTFNVPLAYYQWAATIERDVLLNDLTPHEIAGLVAALSTPTPESDRDTVERVARAICGKDWQECSSPCVKAGKCVGDGWTGCVDFATAAISALRGEGVVDGERE